MSEPAPDPAADGAVAEHQLSYQIILFFAALALGSLTYVVLNLPFEMMMGAAAERTSSDAAAEGQQYVKQIWAAVPLLIVGYAAFALVVQAVREADLR
jgi:heme/copper-type cytochrome/quinol oxidase subunit 2